MHAAILKSYDAQWDMAQLVDRGSIRFFNHGMIGCRTFIAVYHDQKIVGLASLTESSNWHDNAIGVGYISTHKGYRKKGVAKLLVETLFNYAATTHRDISNTSYEPDGKLYLRHVMQRVSTQHPEVTLYER